MKRKTFYSIIVMLVTVTLKAQAPSGYYDSAEGLLGTQLMHALHNIISNDDHLSYSGLWTAFYTTDYRPDDPSTLWDIYTDLPNGTSGCDFTIGADQCGNYSSECDCYNKEHLWPQSWFNDETTPRTDLHHVFPTDGKVNGLRSNYAFGEVINATTTTANGSKLGRSNECSVAFEPIDEYKGDIARALFYMSVRYYSEDQGWKTSDMTNKSTLKPWAIEMLLEWHANDPVSQKEINRNNAVYEIQGNRNPFIDNPEYALMIWDETYQLNEESYNEISVAPNPVRHGENIVVTADDDFTAIAMYDLAGRCVSISYNQRQAAEGVVVAIPTDLKPGIYLMTINRSDKADKVMKVVVR